MSLKASTTPWGPYPTKVVFSLYLPSGLSATLASSLCSAESSGSVAHLCGWRTCLQNAREMATHSRVLAWRIPWTEEPGGLGLQRGGRNWATHTSLIWQLPGSQQSPILNEQNTWCLQRCPRIFSAQVQIPEKKQKVQLLALFPECRVGYYLKNQPRSFLRKTLRAQFIFFFSECLLSILHREASFDENDDYKFKK